MLTEDKSDNSQAQPLPLSRYGQHLVYERPCAPGESKAGFILSDSRVKGMHTEGVNHRTERVRQAKTMEGTPSSFEQF